MKQAGNNLLFELTLYVKMNLRPTGIKHTNKHNDKCVSTQSYCLLNSSRSAARNISNRHASSYATISLHVTTLTDASCLFMPPCLLWSSERAISPRRRGHKSQAVLSKHRRLCGQNWWHVRLSLNKSILIYQSAVKEQARGSARKGRVAAIV